MSPLLIQIFNDMNVGDICNINVFCSASRGQIKEINQWLIPSLNRQKNIGRLTLSIINYNPSSKIEKEDLIKTKITINIVNSNELLGFGEAHNFLFYKLNPKKFFLIINPDIYIDENCIAILTKSFKENIGLVEARQLPFTHPKDITQKEAFETDWASGSCVLINSTFFRGVKGFDPNYWMYLEDVDLSWQAIINNYRVIQNPNAIVNHYTGAYFKYSQNSYELEHFWSIRNFLYISHKFFGNGGERKALNTIQKLPLDSNLIDAAIRDFYKFKEAKNIQQVSTPSNLLQKIRIYGFNKFSQYPT